MARWHEPVAAAPAGSQSRSASRPTWARSQASPSVVFFVHAFWKEQDEQAKQNQFAHFAGASQIKRRTTASEKLRAPADVRSEPVALLPSWQAVVMKSSQPTPRGA